jgi:hypothetical protein
MTKDGETIRRLRLGNLRTLFRHRYGYEFPDDDAGREDLKELLLPVSVGPDAGIKMPKVIELWAPWMALPETGHLIDEINRTPIGDRKPNAKVLGDRLGVTNELRDRLSLWTIAACDLTTDEAAERRKAKARERLRRYRQKQGCKPRAEYETTSVNRTKPWIALNMSRRTWYRQRGTSLKRTKASISRYTPVPTEQASPSWGGRGEKVLKTPQETESRNEARGKRIRLAS